MCYFVKTFSPAFLFLHLKQGSLHVDYHVYVVLVAARILSYFSCDVSDLLFVYKYSVELLLTILKSNILFKNNQNCLNELIERDSGLCS